MLVRGYSNNAHGRTTSCCLFVCLSVCAIKIAMIQNFGSKVCGITSGNMCSKANSTTRGQKVGDWRWDN